MAEVKWLGQGHTVDELQRRGSIPGPPTPNLLLSPMDPAALHKINSLDLPQPVQARANYCTLLGKLQPFHILYLALCGGKFVIFLTRT